MSHKWICEVTNDPDRDYDLYYELLEDDQYRGRIYATEEGKLMLRLYPYEGNLHMPCAWLAEVLQGAVTDLLSQSADDGPT